MKIIIAEKKQLAEAIAEAISGVKRESGGIIRKGNYAITYTGGHAITFMDPEEINHSYKKWSVSQLPIFFEEWPKKPIQGKEQIIKRIKELIFSPECEMVIHAGDIDEEGQFLIDEILEYLNYQGKVMRLDTANTNKNVIAQKLLEMEDNKIWELKGKSAEARAVSDICFGLTMTRFFTCINDTKEICHVGRVKIPTLGMVVFRDRLIEDHKAIKHYVLIANTLIGDKPISVKAELSIDKKSKILTDGKVLNKDIIKDIGEKITGKEFMCDIKKKSEKESPPLPFNLSELQLYCSKKFGYTPSETLEITQNLRDNYNAISYNRTDCQYLTAQHFEEAPETAKTVINNLNLNDIRLDFSIRSKAFNDDAITAHFGIIPHNEKLDLNSLSEKEKNVYEAISTYYLAQFLPYCEKEKTELIIEIDAEKCLKAVASKIIFEGYKSFLNENLEKDDDESATTETELIFIPEGRYKAVISDTDIVERETKPPKRYSEATLADDMTRISKYVKDENIKEILKRKDKGKRGENGSIGTPATRAAIISDLKHQGYIKEDKKHIISTEKGRELINALPEAIKGADTTAIWWTFQENIMEGKAQPDELINSVLSVMQSVMETTKSIHVGSLSKGGNVIGKCPKCGSDIVEVDNPKLQAFVCSNKSCEFIIWKNFLGKKIGIDDAQRLLLGKMTKKLSFKSKEGKPYKASLKWTDNTYSKLQMSFEKKQSYESTGRKTK